MSGPTTPRRANTAMAASSGHIVSDHVRRMNEIVRLLKSDGAWDEQWKYSTKALVMSFVESCKTHCMTQLDSSGPEQQLLFDAICKALTAWLSLSVSDPSDPREKAERADAAATAVLNLGSVASSKGRVKSAAVKHMDLQLHELEVTTANLWEEKERDPRFIQLVEDPETGQQLVRCASLNQIVYKITDADSSDLAFLRTVLLTYQTFVTPKELFHKLTQRFDIPKALRMRSSRAHNVQLRVYNVVKQWIQTSFLDWDQELCDECRQWITGVGGWCQCSSWGVRSLALPDPKWADVICGLLSKAILEENRRILEDVKYSYFQGVGISVSRTDFLQMDTQLIADQLTIFSSELFSRLALGEVRCVGGGHLRSSPHQLVSGAWSKEETKHRAPTVMAMIAAFNSLSRWVQTVVLGE